MTCRVGTLVGVVALVLEWLRQGAVTNEFTQCCGYRLIRLFSRPEKHALSRRVDP